MPTPKVPGVVRAQVVLQGASNLPEDRFVNTFHFDTTPPEGFPAPLQVDYDAIATEIQRFYNDATNVDALSVANLISDVVLRTAASHIRMYHLGDDEPRQPELRPLNLAGPVGAANMPSELAIAGSYFSGQNVEGKRGRIYVGPLRDTAMAAPVIGTDRRVATVAQGVIAAAMRRLADRAAEIHWVVLSQGRRELITLPDGKKRRQGALLPPARHNVTAGWVDNAFDVQRRRGVDASARTLW